MKLSPEERAERRESFRRMGPAQKLEYLFSYYRLPIALTLLALVVLGDAAYRQLTRKEVLLYTGYFNIAVGETLDEALGPGYVESAGLDQKKNQVLVYRDLYLSRDPSEQDHQYAYATRMKLLASIQAQKLDVVLMNREAYDLLSQDGYLSGLPALLGQEGALLSLAEPFLTENTVILEDNAIEYNLNEAETYEAVTEQSVNGLDVSSLPLFREAGFSDQVYLGVIGNSPRLPQVFQYIRYLLSAGAEK